MGCDEEHATYFYDETGASVRDEQRLMALREGAERDNWIISAMALQQVDEDDTVDRKGQRIQIPTRTQLYCRACEKNTVHRFSELEDVPDNKWTGQPVWECQSCGTSRYGPEYSGSHQ